MTAVYRQDNDNCAILTLNRPEVRNAMNDGIVSALEKHLDDIEDSSIRAVIITGNGKGFCAGTDLKEMLALGTESYFKRIDRMHQLFQRLRNLHCPSIAAIHGPALGGGTELAAACTFRLATQDALLGLPEILLGVMPCYGGTQYVTRLIGENQALELILTGKTITAQKALDIGLVNRLVHQGQELIPAALAFAAEFTPYSFVAQQAIRKSVAAALDGSLDEGIAIERQQAHIAFSSEDAREGVSAFLEKRTATFKDC